MVPLAARTSTVSDAAVGTAAQNPSDLRPCQPKSPHPSAEMSLRRVGCRAATTGGGSSDSWMIACAR